jgi:preprotein translocase subunit SecA
MAVPFVGSTLKKVFGTRNDRVVKGYLRTVQDVSALEGSVRPLTDAELRQKTDSFREQLAGGANVKDLTPEIFAVAREAMDRAVGIRSIFNPDLAFDPTTLPADAQALYEQTKASMDAVEARPPTEDLAGGRAMIPSWQFVDIPNRLYEAVRELHPVSKPPYRSRPFDVQIIGAIVLSEGRIAEMKTGEGKTIVAPLAAYRAALQGQSVHVVTVNDYLVQRDRDWVFPFFRALGMTVGSIHPQHMQPPQMKQLAYRCDVVYGTTAEFGFDYLRDNMKLSPAEQVQGTRNMAIIDEVDSILIDEARTPLIISGSAHRSEPRYQLADEIAQHLVARQKDWSTADERVQSKMVEISGVEGDIRNARDKDKVPELKARLEKARAELPGLETERDRYVQFYEVELDKKKATLTHEGIEEAQRRAGVGSFYVGDNIDLPHLLEQSIRAHTVYQRDRDYVVAPDDRGEESVVIVDQNTGRKMVGRQWSDGLHQAVEAKERVPIKEETQTMATITIQNFFKLYDRLGGMTGTADTEATEFHEIYKLDVVVIPTNVPIARIDWNDLVFMSEKDKWDAIVAEIRRFWQVGKPVLVGTTSVEKSEMLSQRLKDAGNIPHEVLNARQHEREADIVAAAGELGSVAVATNMAGRGTDIKLRPFSREALVEHWKRSGIAGRDVRPDMDDDELIAACERHLATKELGWKKSDFEGRDHSEIRLELLRHWVVTVGMAEAGKAATMSATQCEDLLDSSGSMLLHRLRVFSNTEELGGLHVIGTERHESRRVDNQLRGRSGRQGDNGSSRFFLSLEDDLMKMFAGKATLGLLSKLGMKEGDVIENPMLTKSVGKAQRKVEERNFLIRKQILEYDEVMDHQRHEFYGMRQGVLEGRQVKELIFEHIENSVNEHVYRYLDPGYAGTCMAEWVTENLGVTLEGDRFRKKDREELREFIALEAKEEASSMIRLAMGEFMPDEAEVEDWDLKSLADWAAGHFGDAARASELLGLGRREVFERVEQVAHDFLDQADLDPLDQFLVPLYGAKEMAAWCKSTFNAEVDPERLDACETLDDAVVVVMDEARAAYRTREVEYPVEFAMQMTGAQLQQDPQRAIEQFCVWARFRFELDWTPETLPTTRSEELARLLVEEARSWDDAKIADRVRRGLAAAGGDADKMDEWLMENAGSRLTTDERERFATDPEGVLDEKIHAILRTELTQFERWVLLQIVDQAWKDHLYAVDQLRESIGFRSFSQRDPRIEFKREAAKLFEDMESGIRDKVTDLVFKGRLMPQAGPPAGVPAGAPAPGGAGQAPNATPGAPGAPGTAAAAAAAAASAGGATATAPRPPQAARPSTAAVAATPEQQRDIDAANEAGVPEGERPKPRPVQNTLTIGRNEVVKIANPATGETQELKFKKAEPLLKEGWRLVNR